MRNQNQQTDYFVEIIKRAFPLVVSKHGRPGDTGGFVYVGDTQGLLHCHTRVAYPDHKKWHRFVDFSREKATRLAEHTDHQLSSQSRDDEKERFSGAVRGPDNMLYSFSGLPQETDEALVLSGMVHAGIITDSFAIRLLSKCHSSNTDHFLEIHELVSKIV